MTRVWVLILAAMLPQARPLAANPPDVSLEIALPRGRTVWRQGEVIPLTLRLRSSVPNRWMAQTRMQDRSGRLNYVEEFHVEPAAGVRDPMKGLLGGIGGGASGGPVVLGAEPYEYVRNLNEWVQFERPGTYRLVVVSRRVSRLAEDFDPTERIMFRRSAEPVELTSNALTIEIVEASAQWAATELQRALQLLSAPVTQAYSDEKRRRGGRILRFLGTRQAAQEMALRLSAGYEMPVKHFRFGVLTSPHAGAVVPFMEERLVAPDQPVNQLFIDTLTTLAVSVKEGPSAALSDKPYNEMSKDEQKRRLERNRARDRRRRALRADYYDRLAAALPNKNPKPRSVCAAALSSFATQQGGAPEWRRAITNYLREGFAELPASEQRDLLSHRWYEIAGREMIPVLENVYQHPGDRSNRQLENLALRRLYELDPPRERRAVLEEIVAPTRGLELKTLTMLEESSLPEAFESFAAHLRRGGEGPDQLILRYGDESLLEFALLSLRFREKASAETGQATCVSPLHLFVLREAPEHGETILRRAVSSSAAKQPHCLDLRRLVPGRYAWSPRLEKLLNELLDHKLVIAKDSAAELLGKYGSPEAEKQIWAAFEAFSDWWEGREEELMEPGMFENAQLERTLRSALARGSAWMLDVDAMARLRGMCVSNECRYEVDNWIAASAEPVEVSIWNSGPESFTATVGRFHLRSPVEFKAKLRQFPAGARFRWGGRPGPGSREALIELTREVEFLLPGLR